MTVYRFPVLCATDATGLVTALLVEDSVSAVGATRQQAVQQLKDYLQNENKKRPFNVPDGEFEDPEMITFAVRVVPEYRSGDRLFALDETVTLPVVAVRGRLPDNGPRICALPLLDIRFFYHEPKALKGLVTHYVQQAVKGMTPQSLSRFLPPGQVELDEISLQLKPKPRHMAGPGVPPNLQQVAEPLGDRQVRRGWSRAYRRDDEVTELVRRLAKDRANVILLGESGVGKTSILVDAVAKIEKELDPNAKQDDDHRDDDGDGQPNRNQRRFWMTSAQRLIAGMRWLGQWELRVDEIIEELAGIRGTLCLDNLLDLVLTGGEGPTDSVAAYFMPFLQHGQLQMVIEATPATLDACRRLLPGFAELFQVMRIDEFDRTGALAVLDRLAQTHARNAHVDLDEGVTATIWRLFRRFMPYSVMPGRAAAFTQRMVDIAQRDEASLSNAIVLREFIRETGLPELFLRDDQPLLAADVRATLERDVIGQPAACEVATSVVTSFKSGLNDPQRPLGVLLFAGPTGVGKTSLARALAKFFFGHGDDGDRLIRLDMSEYSGIGAVERLIGRPGAAPGEIVRRVREQPFTVVLLDEIEKASPDVFDVLLGMLDEGRLTDRYGRVTNFRSAVIIMTSNLGADRANTIGYGVHDAATFDSEAARFFRPEFYNRIDEVVTFTPLSEDAIRLIAAKELGEIATREGLLAADLRLTWSERLLDELVAIGFDPVYGARPLQRAIEQSVIAPLARYVVENPTRTNTTLHLDVGESRDETLTVTITRS